ENAEEEMDLDPIPFAYKLMTRSKKIDHAKLKQRDPEFVAAYDRWARSQRSEVRGQKSEVRGQKDRGQRSEVRSRKVDSRRSGSRNRKR
ncbi:MAG TPA: hypothetical protein VKF81_12255, partial [Blastocatellia bacterium]|nr:hypothetical protein [Blastocatellia bacterium]